MNFMNTYLSTYTVYYNKYSKYKILKRKKISRKPMRAFLLFCIILY